jgi:hypothetical protein
MRGQIFAGAGAIGLISLMALAPADVRADTLANWTFETNPPADSTGAIGPSVGADNGTGSFGGVHVSAASMWTTPSGAAASANSYSSDHWGGTAGNQNANYYQFNTTSTGYEDINVSFAVMGSNTGPKNFQFAYSTDNSAYTNFGSAYVVPANFSTVSFDLSSVGALDNQATIYFRLLQIDSVSIANGTVGTGGTSRVDNIVVSASQIQSAAVPLPLAAWGGLVLIGGTGLVKRWRSSAIT